MTHPQITIRDLPEGWVHPCTHIELDNNFIGKAGVARCACCFALTYEWEPTFLKSLIIGENEGYYRKK